MKSLEQQMSFYEAYHKNTLNKLTHFFGIPAIIFSILIPMTWIRFSIFSVELSGAMLFSLGVIIYYFRLNYIMAVLFAFTMLPVIYGAEVIGKESISTGLLWFGVFFVGGWILQLIGHIFEKRRPAFTENLFQLLIGPFFLIAELFFLAGFFKETHKRIIELSKEHM